MPQLCVVMAGRLFTVVLRLDRELCGLSKDGYFIHSWVGIGCKWILCYCWSALFDKEIIMWTSQQRLVLFLAGLLCLNYWLCCQSLAPSILQRATQRTAWIHRGYCVMYSRWCRWQTSFIIKAYIPVKRPHVVVDVSLSMKESNSIVICRYKKILMFCRIFGMGYCLGCMDSLVSSYEWSLRRYEVFLTLAILGILYLGRRWPTYHCMNWMFKAGVLLQPTEEAICFQLILVEVCI